MKKIIFVTHFSEGIERSPLMINLAQEQPEFLLPYREEASEATFFSLRDCPADLCSLQGPDENVDRGLFETFSRMISRSEGELFICDLSPALVTRLGLLLDYEGDEELSPAEASPGPGVEFEVCALVYEVKFIRLAMAHVHDPPRLPIRLQAPRFTERSGFLFPGSRISG
jgi:hypothetical protein